MKCLALNEGKNSAYPHACQSSSGHCHSRLELHLQARNFLMKDDIEVLDVPDYSFITKSGYKAIQERVYEHVNKAVPIV